MKEKEANDAVAKVPQANVCRRSFLQAVLSSGKSKSTEKDG